MSAASEQDRPIGEVARCRSERIQPCPSPLALWSPWALSVAPLSRASCCRIRPPDLKCTHMPGLPREAQLLGLVERADDCLHRKHMAGCRSWACSGRSAGDAAWRDSGTGQPKPRGLALHACGGARIVLREAATCWKMRGRVSRGVRESSAGGLHGSS